MKVLAIDDEPLALQQLASYIRKIPFFELTAACQSAFEAQAVMEKESIDALFIDINMPDLNGLDFVRTLDTPPIIVFTTAYSDYAVEGYKVDAVGYLLKPFGMEEFQQVANKVKARHELLQQAEASPIDDDDAIFLKSEYKIIRINVDEIRYVEAMSEYLKIYTDHRPKPIVALLSMKKMEERLPASTFMRIHRSYIVNLRKIAELSKNRVLLGADESLPIGDLYREPLQQYIERKFLGK